MRGVRFSKAIRETVGKRVRARGLEDTDIYRATMQALGVAAVAPAA
jgi:hypothetical protein